MKCEIYIILHATEDEEKVIKSVLSSLKLNENNLKISKQVFTGHYGNPIIYYTISYGENAKIVLEHILKNLKAIDKVELTENLSDYIQGSKLYLRLDKQSICVGELKLSQADAVKIIFKGVNKKYLARLLNDVLKEVK